MRYNDPLRDLTRDMLDKMHQINHKKMIIEQFDERIELKEDQVKEEEKKFRSTVSPKVEFKKFLIYPKDYNIEWAGKFIDSDVEWVYSLKETNGVYISGDLLKLDDNMMNTLKKLTGYYQTWSDEWANKIAEDYDVKSSEEEKSEPQEKGTEENI